ncbi:MAG: hypothetical protein LQ340_005836 [Diploschistes diacapsis]|nr:MAG: hypothetical protein LQ340_005836 [Diploschistes diacapsis]
MFLACTTSQHGLRKKSLHLKASLSRTQVFQLHIDGRARLSNFWIPTGGIAYQENVKEDSNALLIRGGFMRQSHAGVFQLLPLGLRVQKKIEDLLDKHMSRLGASKVSLSTLSSEEIWRQSGRLQNDRAELFHVEDRKGSKFLLAPTHEEEITTLVGGLVHSYKDLPLRLYQIGRKYRDELRPREGLLRTREFLMKDLYTFDISKEKALETYEIVRAAYSAFFKEFKTPYLIADADSGSIGGDINHEYHIASEKGEDIVYSCKSCGFNVNEELLGSNSSLNKEKGVCSCSKCSSQMESVKTIELGHTFYLGTKYSKPLGAVITTKDSGHATLDLAANRQDAAACTPMEMGCHGIGISRLIAGMANVLSDDKGLNWPGVIAPFETVIISTSRTEEPASQLAGQLSHTVDAILDDRDQSLVWKMKDADLIGYPVLVIFGRAWAKEGKCEVQCRRLGVRENVAREVVPEFVQSLVAKL